MNWYKFNISSFTEEEYENCLRLMEKSKQSRVKSITHEPTRKMSVFAEWKAKNVLAELLKKPVEKVNFTYSDKGKPLLSDGSLHFSISHSGSFAAVAVADKPIGIDIEEIRPINIRLANRLCTESDMEFLFSEEDGVNERLLKIWTAKEAYFKKIGTGIIDLKAVSYKDLSPLHFFEDNLIITIV